jgi:hypothetical protein
MWKSSVLRKEKQFLLIKQANSANDATLRELAEKSVAQAAVNPTCSLSTEQPDSYHKAEPSLSPAQSNNTVGRSLLVSPTSRQSMVCPA